MDQTDTELALQEDNETLRCAFARPQAVEKDADHIAGEWPPPAMLKDREALTYQFVTTSTCYFYNPNCSNISPEQQIQHRLF